MGSTHNHYRRSYPSQSQPLLVDMLYLGSHHERGSEDGEKGGEHLQELAAALGGGLVTRGHTLVVVDGGGDGADVEGGGRGDGATAGGVGGRHSGAPLVGDFMTRAGCDRRLGGGRHAGWVC